MRRLRIAIFLAASALLGCGDDSTGSGLAGKPCPDYPLTRMPIGADAFMSMLALGNAAPPGHIQPTTHMYFMVKTDSARAPIRTAVYAPGDMQVTRIFRQDYHRAKDDASSPVYHTDYRIDFDLCDKVSGYFVLVYDPTPEFIAAVGDLDQGFTEGCTFFSGLRACSKRFSNGKEIKAGTHLGYAGKASDPAIGSLDIGVTDAREDLPGYTRTLAKRRLQDRFNVACPLDYYDPALGLRAAMWEKIGSITGSSFRSDADRCGKVDWESPGSVSGIWFPEGYAASDESSSLVLMGFNVDPAYGMFSIGPRPAQSFGISSQGVVYPIAADPSGGLDFINPRFEQARMDVGIACFEGLKDQYGYEARDFIILARVDDDTHMTMEVRKGTTLCPKGHGERAFTEAAARFGK